MRIGHVFPVLVGLVLIGCNCVSARFTVLTQKSPVVAAVGDMAVFNCRASNFNELTEVRWIRTQADRRYIINLFRDGRDQEKCELPEYIGRMEVMKEELARGGVALKLFNVSIADEGVYRCYLETLYYFDFGDLELRVTALGSDPRIDIEGFQDGGIKAVCRSVGWYPEPTLVNKGDNGEMKMQKEENGLYSIEYSRVIKENSNRTFSCKLRTMFPNQERETSVYLADALFMERTETIVRIAALTVTFLTLSLFPAMVAMFIRRTRLKHKQERSLSTASRTRRRRQKPKRSVGRWILKLPAEPIKETTGPELNIIPNCSCSNTSLPDETVAKLRKEMEANIAVALKWQKEAEMKDKEALEKEQELLKMEAHLGKLLTMQSCPRDCVQPPPDDTTELMSAMAPRDPAAST